MDIGLVLFCAFVEVDFVSVHKEFKLGQYPAILTLLENAYVPGFLKTGLLKNVSLLH